MLRTSCATEQANIASTKPDLFTIHLVADTNAGEFPSSHLDFNCFCTKYKKMHAFSVSHDKYPPVVHVRKFLRI